MKIDTQKSSRYELSICEDTKHTLGYPIVYRLFAIGSEKASRFMISITEPNEICNAEAGSDALRAIAYYRQIVGGNVTPCTLKEVLSDLRYLDLM